MSSADKPVLLIVSQVYVPDPASVGQHLHDVATEMARRGHRVVVLTSRRGYEDTSQTYPWREVIDGVEIQRLSLSSFGKERILKRLVGGSTFMAQALAVALGMRRIDRMLISTSPPMCAMLAIALHQLRRTPITYWVMDINPDQVVASGGLATTSAPVRAFEWMNRRILDTADQVITLDRFMAARLRGKGRIRGTLAVIPPWPHVEADAPPVEHERNPFREGQGLMRKFVVMYSGNLSPVHPVKTILKAAKRLSVRDDILFLFVGGGLGKQGIERYIAKHALTNVRTLPYQPLALLHNSLSAADLHLVSMGEAMVGIVHPCKVYGAMAVARPLLVLAPNECHLADLVSENGIGYQIAHEDVDAAVKLIAELADGRDPSLHAKGERARHAVTEHYSKGKLCGALCDVIEQRERTGSSVEQRRRQRQEAALER